MIRKQPLQTGKIYHITSKAIFTSPIFRCEADYHRFLKLLSYYRKSQTPFRFSYFLKHHANSFCLIDKMNDDAVQILAYSILPTTMHLVVRQLKDRGISKFVRDVLNGYSRYFNSKYGQSGKLWAGRFKNQTVDLEEELLHLTRYIHLAPILEGVVSDLNSWRHSSLDQYCPKKKNVRPVIICKYEDLLDITKEKYQSFVEDENCFKQNFNKIKKFVGKECYFLPSFQYPTQSNGQKVQDRPDNPSIPSSWSKTKSIKPISQSSQLRDNLAVLFFILTIALATTGSGHASTPYWLERSSVAQMA